MIYHVYNGELSQVGDLQKLGSIPKELLPSYKAMLTSVPKQRLPPSEFLTCAFFKNPFVETALFLENFALKESHEKDSFFKYVVGGNGPVIRSFVRTFDRSIEHG